MYCKFAECETPPDNRTVWRYMNLAKFLDLLNSQELFFSRLGALTDKYEGAMSTPTMEEVQRLLPPDYRMATRDDMRFTEVTYHLMRASTFINCWHMNTNESAAMWSQYARDGIAIKSTIGRMKDAFEVVPQDIFIGKVRYMNFTIGRMNANSAVSPVFFKRLSFGHEQEVRAVLLDFPAGPDGSSMSHEYLKDARNWPNGSRIRVDVDRLIQRVHVSPGRPDWYRELVHSLVHRLGYSVPIEASRIDKRPNFI